jgi:hypothetical protein
LGDNRGDMLLLDVVGVGDVVGRGNCSWKDCLRAQNLKYTKRVIGALLQQKSQTYWEGRKELKRRSQSYDGTAKHIETESRTERETPQQEICRTEEGTKEPKRVSECYHTGYLQLEREHRVQREKVPSIFTA